MAGTYWLTVLPDTSKLKPAIESAMRGQKITADFGVDRSKAKKAGKDAAETAKQEADKSKPKISPEADKPASKKAGEDAAEEAAKPIRNKRPKVKPDADVPGSRRAGEEAGGAAAGGMLTSVKKLAPMLGGLSILGGLKSSIAEGMAFTESLNVMKGVTSASGDEMARVSSLARQLGTDVNLTGINANDAATAMTELAKGGMNVQQSMDAVRGTLALASAAGIEAGQAAEIQSDALNMFRISATDSTRVADLLVNAANASSSEVPQMAQALAQAGSAASGFGVSIEDTLTSLAMFSNFGIKGSDAGTLMKSSLLAITDGGKPAQAAIKELGLELYNATGQFVGYPAMLEQVAQASTRMSEEQFQGATAVLFGSDAMRGAMIAANGGAEAFNKTADAVRNGAGAAGMAAARNEGLVGAWGNFTNKLDEVKMSISDMLDGPLESLLNKLTGLPDFVSRNSDAFKILGGIIATVAVPAITLWIAAQAKALVMSTASGIASLIGSWRTLASVIINAAAAAGTYLIAIGRVIAASIVSGFTAMVGAIRNLALGTKLVTAAQWLWNAAMTANPIGLIVAAVAALVAGLVWFFTKTELGQKIWKGFTDFLVSAWDMIKNAFATAWESIKSVFQSLLDKAGEVWDGIKTKFTAVVDFVKGLPGQISSAAKGMWDGIGNAFKSAVNGMIRVWNSFAGALSFTTPDWVPGIGGKSFSLPTIAEFAGGGRISGPGGGTSDSILARLSDGEYVINAASTSKYLPLIEAINRDALPGFAQGGLTPHASEMRSVISRMFGVNNIGGYREPDGYNEHSTGNALDVMIPDSDTEKGKALGNAIAAWALKNAKAIGLTGMIWRQTSYGYGNGFNGTGTPMPDRGSPTANHMDHVHIFMNDKPDTSLSLSGATSVGASTSAGGGSTSYRAATSSELSASSNRVDAANKAVTQAQQRVDDRTFNRDQAQKRLDRVRADGKDDTNAAEMLRRAERELTDATTNLTEKRDKAAEVEQADTDLRTNGKQVTDTAASSAGSATSSTGKSGPNTGDLGKMFVGGVLESIGLDGSLFSNPLEWPSVKSLMAGINWAGGLLSVAGAKPEDQGGTATTVGGGFAAGAADAVGLGGLVSAIPSIAQSTLPSGTSGSPALAPGEFNPAVAGGTAVTGASGMSAFVPAAHTGSGNAPGPGIDNSININGNVGMDPAALQTKLRTEQNARTRTTVMR